MQRTESLAGPGFSSTSPERIREMKRKEAAWRAPRGEGARAGSMAAVPRQRTTLAAAGRERSRARNRKKLERLGLLVRES